MGNKSNNYLRKTQNVSQVYYHQGVTKGMFQFHTLSNNHFYGLLFPENGDKKVNVFVVNVTSHKKMYYLILMIIFHKKMTRLLQYL